MPAIEFRKTREIFRFKGAEGEAIARDIEIRFDPLTGASSRVRAGSSGPVQPPDLSDVAAQTAGAHCPFCPENLHRMTPDFESGMAPGGKLVHGQVTVFPNLFPYTAHNGVAVLGSQHFRRLDEFSVELLTQGFEAAQDYVRRVQAASSERLSAAINWNYLPASGGSILHPHLHVTLSATPSNQQRQLDTQGDIFRQRWGRDYLSALCEAEQAGAERWIGQWGTLRWLHAFAPASDNDFLGVFEADRIAQLQPSDWQALAQGLRAVFASLAEQGLASFNLMMTESSTMPLQLRLVSRRSYGALGTSDINFFQMLHHEPMSTLEPERVAALARRHFAAISGL